MTKFLKMLEKMGKIFILEEIQSHWSIFLRPTILGLWCCFMYPFAFACIPARY